MKISKQDRAILKKAEIILHYCCASQDNTCSNCPLKNSCDELENHSIPYFLHDIIETLEAE